MADAKKCDVCGRLYEADDSKNTTNLKDFNYNRPQIDTQMRMYHRHRDIRLDHCPACTESGIRAFMRKFSIKEEKGTVTLTEVSRKNNQLYFGGESDEETVNHFFEQYEGNRIRMTIEVIR